MYTTILWDLDNTLLDFTASERYAFHTCMRDAGIETTEELLAAYSRINLSFWKMLERGEITKDALLEQRFIRFFESVGIRGVDTVRFRNLYQRLLGSVYYYLDDSYELCERLHQTHRQYIVTNGVAATQRSKLRLSRLSLVTDGCFISEEIGYDKPSPQFFERSFAQIPDFHPEEAILVGDSTTSDMLGANHVGIACCWYNPAHLPQPADIRIDYTISHLSKLTAIVSA